MKAIELNNISLSLDGKKILDNVTLNVEKGSVYGLVGYNGAGKTSLLRIMLGLNVHYSGTVRFFESHDIMLQSQKIGTVIDSLSLDPGCDANEYLCCIGRLHKNFDKTKIAELLDIVGLENVHKKKIYKYSMGMKRRLSLAAALIGEPQILILDEPFNGIDIEGMNEIGLILQELALNGMTILVTSHIIPELIKLSNVFGILYQGRLVGEISAEKLAMQKKTKLSIKIKDARHFSQEMKKKYPNVCCISNQPGSVSLLGKNTEEPFREILEKYHINSKDIVQEIMNEEEHLLYMMNGSGL